MVDKWVTIKEAIEITGRSESTIRRLTRSLNTGNEQVRKERIAGGYLYLISLDFLEKEYGLDPKEDNISGPGPTTEGRLIDLLEKQIAEKDRQIQALLERTREQNNIIMALRSDNKLLLTSGLTTGEHGHEQAIEHGIDQLSFGSFIKWIGKFFRP